MPKKITIDGLAAIIKNEFDNVNGELNSIKGELKTAAKDRKEMKRSLEEIKMKFAYTAWQIDVEDLKKRIAKVEQKIGVKNQ